MLTSILYIRSGLKRIKKCCNDFKFPHSVVKEIGTVDIYNSHNADDNQELFDHIMF